MTTTPIGIQPYTAQWYKWVAKAIDDNCREAKKIARLLYIPPLLKFPIDNKTFERLKYA